MNYTSYVKPMKPGRWSFFSNHLHVLECLLRHPGATLVEVAALVEISPRAVQTIVNDLVEAGYLVRSRHGRRNSYVVDLDAPLRHAINADIPLRDFIGPLVDQEQKSIAKRAQEPGNPEFSAKPRRSPTRRQTES
ncbi:MAG TPA: winged helix-turn-helix domain-containing protein [Chloroflexota bacterium]|nr:winged helix-turn-helix domain-containing protein [Chloroflexota bacterium]